MKSFENSESIICGKRTKVKDWFNPHTHVCKKVATHTNGSHYFCRHHSKTGRYIARIGDVGKTMARFDTEQQLRDNIHLYPGCRMQKVTKSHRRDIF
jgi:hypothetical protein